MLHQLDARFEAEARGEHVEGLRGMKQDEQLRRQRLLLLFYVIGLRVRRGSRRWRLLRTGRAKQSMRPRRRAPARPSSRLALPSGGDRRPCAGRPHARSRWWARPCRTTPTTLYSKVERLSHQDRGRHRRPREGRAVHRRDPVARDRVSRSPPRSGGSREQATRPGAHRDLAKKGFFSQQALDNARNRGAGRARVSSTSCAPELGYRAAARRSRVWSPLAIVDPGALVTNAANNQTSSQAGGHHLPTRRGCGSASTSSRWTHRYVKTRDRSRDRGCRESRAPRQGQDQPYRRRTRFANPHPADGSGLRQQQGSNSLPAVRQRQPTHPRDQLRRGAGAGAGGARQERTWSPSSAPQSHQTGADRGGRHRRPRDRILNGLDEGVPVVLNLPNTVPDDAKVNPSVPPGSPAPKPPAAAAGQPAPAQPVPAANAQPK